MGCTISKYCMKKNVIIVIILIIAVFGALVVVREFDQQIIQISDIVEQKVIQTPTIVENTENEVHEGGPTEFDPVSLLALMEKDFDGRGLELGKVLERNSAYTRYYITYKSGELTISGILNIPKGNVPEGGFPVLFLNHGHIDTSIYTNGRGLRREQDYLARQGFAVLHSDYRNHAQSDKDEDNESDVRLGYIEDVINAVYAVKNSDIPELSKEKFGMLGHSMGGGIAQAVMVVKPDLVDAVVLYAPVSSDVVDSFERWTKRNSSALEGIVSKHGTPETNPEFWVNMSPRTFFDRVSEPVMIFHGTADADCDIEWSRDTHNLLLAAGKNVELVEYPGEPHEFAAAHEDFMKKSAKFFEVHLRRQ